MENLNTTVTQLENNISELAILQKKGHDIKIVLDIETDGKYVDINSAVKAKQNYANDILEFACVVLVDGKINEKYNMQIYFNPFDNVESRIAKGWDRLKKNGKIVQDYNSIQEFKNGNKNYSIENIVNVEDTPEEVVRIHGLNKERLRELEAKNLAEYILPLNEFIERFESIGHNIDGFDIPFISRSKKDYLPILETIENNNEKDNISSAYKSIDTLKIFKKGITDYELMAIVKGNKKIDYTLDTLNSYIHTVGEIEKMDRPIHGALLDSEVLAESYLMYEEIINIRKNIEDNKKNYYKKAEIESVINKDNFNSKEVDDRINEVILEKIRNYVHSNNQSIASEVYESFNQNIDYLNSRITKNDKIIKLNNELNNLIIKKTTEIIEGILNNENPQLFLHKLKKELDYLTEKEPGKRFNEKRYVIEKTEYYISGYLISKILDFKTNKQINEIVVEGIKKIDKVDSINLNDEQIMKYIKLSHNLTKTSVSYQDGEQCPSSLELVSFAKELDELDNENISNVFISETFGSSFSSTETLKKKLKVEKELSTGHTLKISVPNINNNTENIYFEVNFFFNNQDEVNEFNAYIYNESTKDIEHKSLSLEEFTKQKSFFEKYNTKITTGGYNGLFEQLLRNGGDLETNFNYAKEVLNAINNISNNNTSIEVFHHLEKEQYINKFKEIAALDLNIPITLSNLVLHNKGEYGIKGHLLRNMNNQDLKVSDDVINVYGYGIQKYSEYQKNISNLDYRSIKTHDELLEVIKSDTTLLSILENIENNKLKLQTFKDLHYVAKTRFEFPEFQEDGKSFSQEEAKEKMKTLVFEGVEKRFINNNTPEEEKQKYYDQLNFELDVYEKLNANGYALSVWDIVNFAKSQGIPVGPGRGSAAGSLVAYCLFITNIDPIPYGLLFERFLNPERISRPDIDLDFAQDGRQEVINYIKNKYNNNDQTVCHIVTYGVFGFLSALQKTCSLYGDEFAKKSNIENVYTYMDLVSYLKKVVNVEEFLKIKGLEKDFIEEESEEESANNEKQTTSKKAKNNDFLEELMEKNYVVKEILLSTLALVGTIKNQGIHASAINTIQNKSNVGIQRVLVNGEVKEVQIYDGKSADTKFDILGLKTLDIIRDAILAVEKNYSLEEILKITNKGIDFVNQDPAFALNDYNSLKAITTGKTLGIFQIESDGMKKLATALKPDTFEDIIAMIALYRPGPMESGMLDDFVKRKNREQEISYFFEEFEEKLKPLLDSTYGVIVYQEQVMQIVMELAGFSLGKADLVRRAMGKKDAAEMKREGEAFVIEGVKKGYSEENLQALFNLIVSFAEYGFNKSHSAAYAQLTMITANLKTYFKKEFYATLLNSIIGDKIEKVSKIIDEAKTFDITLLQPAINYSNVLSFANKHENTIRYGLSAVKGAGTIEPNLIVEERIKNGEYKNFYDFLNRIPTIKKGTMEALLLGGTFDEFINSPMERIELMKEYMAFKPLLNKYKKINDSVLKFIKSNSKKSNETLNEINTNQTNLSSKEFEIILVENNILTLEEINILRKTNNGKELFSFEIENNTSFDKEYLKNYLKKLFLETTNSKKSNIEESDNEEESEEEIEDKKSKGKTTKKKNILELTYSDVYVEEYKRTGNNTTKNPLDFLEKKGITTIQENLENKQKVINEINDLKQIYKEKMNQLEESYNEVEQENLENKQKVINEINDLKNIYKEKMNQLEESDNKVEQEEELEKELELKIKQLEKEQLEKEEELELAFELKIEQLEKEEELELENLSKSHKAKYNNQNVVLYGMIQGDPVNKTSNNKNSKNFGKPYSILNVSDGTGNLSIYISPDYTDVQKFVPNTFLKLTFKGEYLSEKPEVLDINEYINKSKNGILFSNVVSSTSMKEDNIITLDEKDIFDRISKEDNQYEYSRYPKKENGVTYPNYELSSKGDNRFSALYAKIGQKSIEEIYQLEIKGYINSEEYKLDKLGYNSNRQGWKYGKGKPSINESIKNEDELFNAYTNLWILFFKLNKDLLKEIQEKAIGKTLTDCFANSSISQARSIAFILNDKLLVENIINSNEINIELEINNILKINQNNIKTTDINNKIENKEEKITKEQEISIIKEPNGKKYLNINYVLNPFYCKIDYKNEDGTIEELSLEEILQYKIKNIDKSINLLDAKKMPANRENNNDTEDLMFATYCIIIFNFLKNNKEKEKEILDGIKDGIILDKYFTTKNRFSPAKAIQEIYKNKEEFEINSNKFLTIIKNINLEEEIVTQKNNKEEIISKEFNIDIDKSTKITEFFEKNKDIIDRLIFIIENSKILSNNGTKETNILMELSYIKNMCVLTYKEKIQLELIEKYKTNFLNLEDIEQTITKHFGTFSKYKLEKTKENIDLLLEFFKILENDLNVLTENLINTKNGSSLKTTVFNKEKYLKFLNILNNNNTPLKKEEKLDLNNSQQKNNKK
jgi:DNA-directed DNA polymerase III PolC